MFRGERNEAPLRALPLVPRHALALGAGQAEAVLRLGEPLLRGLLVPLRGALAARGDARALAVREAERELGLRKPLLRGLAVP